MTRRTNPAAAMNDEELKRAIQRADADYHDAGRDVSEQFQKEKERKKELEKSRREKEKKRNAPMQARDSRGLKALRSMTIEEVKRTAQSQSEEWWVCSLANEELNRRQREAEDISKKVVRPRFEAMTDDELLRFSESTFGATHDELAAADDEVM